MLGLGVVFLAVGFGLLFASIVIGVIVMIIGVVLLFFAFKKKNKFIAEKKEIFFLSQYTPYLLGNPEAKFAILDVNKKPVVVPKNWNVDQTYVIPDIEPTS